MVKFNALVLRRILSTYQYVLVNFKTLFQALSRYLINISKSLYTFEVNRLLFKKYMNENYCHTTDRQSY